MAKSTKMFTSSAAVNKFLRSSNSKAAAATRMILRYKSTPVKNVQVEHGRGVWKTYGDLSNYNPGKYQIKTFNKISPVGLARFPSDEYDLRTGDAEAANAHAILLRSHKLKEEEVPKTVRAIAR
jgi:D-3-phosphoglycerate dehydrogenase